ncbi:MAG: S46 family peptidase [Bacteroidetes bacterium]|nr:MAG: S46 family peptidase [Bacteroidota bacterium]
MKKILAVFVYCLLSTAYCRADEGMWIPTLLKSLNESDMQKLGCKLTAEQIYSVNKSSLKDAVVNFGGCTGEMISDQGLLITNHHCGYGQIQSHSTIEHDYLTNGFWANEKKEELTCPGLTVSFVIRIVDVTSKVLEGVEADLSEIKRDSVVKDRMKNIEKDSVAGTHFKAMVRQFYSGNEFYLFVLEIFTDVRMVGAPPESIGNFGGDTDNWMWPRHTGDFSLFRIYSDKDNKPADYSPDNVPFKPRHFLPVSLKGVSENDFAMIFGFPGRTQEYLPSSAVEMIQKVSNPIKIKAREKRLSIWREDMNKSTEVRIQYSSKHAGVANAYKKWTGEVAGLERINGIGMKQAQEKTFLERIAKNPEWNKKYGSLLSDFSIAYIQIAPYQKATDYFSETVAAVEIIRYANGYLQLLNAKPEDLAKKLETFKTAAKSFFKDYNTLTDRKLFAAMLKMYYEEVDKVMHPEVFETIQSKHKGNFEKYADEIYERSMFASEVKVIEFLNGYTAERTKDIEKDPAYILARNVFGFYETQIKPQYTLLTDGLNKLNREYMAAQREVMTEKKYYPDANSTMRVAFGKINGYDGKDGVRFTFSTTLDGIMEKEDSTDSEFVVPKKLKELYLKKDYGQYAGKDGKVCVAFTTNSHTTGGNSGSPLIDAEGNLIGVNFDRNWEGTANDIKYNSERGRNIVLDIRYALFVIDKFAGATNLIKEMKIIQ